MPFKKGVVTNPQGRRKGSENKEKKALREAILLIVDENRDKFIKELNKLEGVAYIKTITDLLEYCTPKLNRTDLSNEDGSLNINIHPIEFVKTKDE
jgi:hypothetical protein